MKITAVSAGAADCEHLWQIAAREKEKADALCAAVMESFNEYVAEPVAFDKKYRALLEAADVLCI